METQDKEEIFEEVTSTDDLLYLAKVLEEDLPVSVCVYNILLMKAKCGTDIQRVYLLKNHSKSNPVLLCRDKDDLFKIAVYSRASDASHLKAAMINTQVFSKQLVLAAATPDYLVEVVKEALTERCGKPADVRLVPQFVIQDRRQALDASLTECKDGVLCQLGAAGVERMHATWKFNNIVPLGVLHSLYTHVPSCALYINPTKAVPSPPTEKPENWRLPSGPKDEVPVAWIGVGRLGFLGQLMTEESYRGRGYAGMVLKECTRSMAASGLLPASCVEQENLASLNLFLKLGWRKSHCLNWIVCGDAEI